MMTFVRQTWVGSFCATMVAALGCLVISTRSFAGVAATATATATATDTATAIVTASETPTATATATHTGTATETTAAATATATATATHTATATETTAAATATATATATETMAAPTATASATATEALCGGLDVDENGIVQGGTDGVYVFRRMLGLGFIVPTAFRALDDSILDDVSIAANIDALGVGLDVDGSGAVSGATDGVYVFRHLLGLEFVVPTLFRALDGAIPTDEMVSANIDALCGGGS